MLDRLIDWVNGLSLGRLLLYWALLWVGIGVALYHIVRFVQRMIRRRTMKPAAEALGLTYVGKVRRRTVPWLGQLTRTWRIGSAAEHLMTGNFNGHHVMLLEHRYTDSRLRSSRRVRVKTYWETVICLPEATMAPDLGILPRRLAGAAVGDSIGSKLKDAGDREEFRDSFTVVSDDEWARSVPTAVQEVCEAHLAWGVQVHNSDLVIAVRESRKRPDELAAFLTEALKFKEAFATWGASPTPADVVARRRLKRRVMHVVSIIVIYAALIGFTLLAKTIIARMDR